MKKRKDLKRAFGEFQAQEKQKQRREAHEKRLAEHQDRPKAAKKAKKNGKSSANKRIYQPFADGESVLFVGEGNFSFALAFANRFPASAKLSVATSYDRREDALKKYADLEGIIKQVSINVSGHSTRLTIYPQLEEAEMTVLFGVDAQVLEKCKDLKKHQKTEAARFHKIVFNFPHVGMHA